MQGTTQHSFSKVSSRAAPAGVCTPTVASKKPRQPKASINNIQRQCLHRRTTAVPTRLLLDPTYGLQFPHAVVRPPRSIAPQSIGSNRRAHPANIHTRSLTRFRSCNNVSAWRPRPVHRRRKRARRAPPNTGSARLAAVQRLEISSDSKLIAPDPQKKKEKRGE